MFVSSIAKRQKPTIQSVHSQSLTSGQKDEQPTVHRQLDNLTSRVQRGPWFNAHFRRNFVFGNTFLGFGSWRSLKEAGSYMTYRIVFSTSGPEPIMLSAKPITLYHWSPLPYIISELLLKCYSHFLHALIYLSLSGNRYACTVLSCTGRATTPKCSVLCNRIPGQRPL